MKQQAVINELQEDKVSVIISSDNMVGYVKLEKSAFNEKGDREKIEEEILAALKKEGIVYGIKEESVKKLAERPIFGLKIEVVRGEEAINGKNGYINFFVERDSEYVPQYSEEGKIDYKNLDYFQQVSKGQVLCEIIKETESVDGTNIFGAAVPGRSGKAAKSPVGRNTVLTEDGTRLLADVSGVVRFVRDTIDINEVLQIRSNVDQSTGNINFPGDVTVAGDVCYGFSIKCGGSLTVKGMVEGSKIEADGDLTISKGINGAGGEKIRVGGNLRSGYIENADLFVGGNILSDYVIDSNILCRGSIELSGKNELVAGGEISLHGGLTAKNIGNENERPTKIEILGTAAGDFEEINKLLAEQAEYSNSVNMLNTTLKKYSRFGELSHERPSQEKMAILWHQVELIKSKLEEIEKEIKISEGQMVIEYTGFISCKRKLYQGVKICFGNEVFRFGPDDIENCKVFWHQGEIKQITS